MLKLSRRRDRSDAVCGPQSLTCLSASPLQMISGSPMASWPMIRAFRIRAATAGGSRLSARFECSHRRDSRGKEYGGIPKTSAAARETRKA